MTPLEPLATEGPRIYWTNWLHQISLRKMHFLAQLEKENQFLSAIDPDASIVHLLTEKARFSVPQRGENTEAKQESLATARM